MTEFWTSFPFEFLAFLPELVPSLLVITLVVLVLRWIITQPSDKNRGTRFRSQMMGLGIGLIGCVGLLLTLPVDNETRGQLLTVFGLLLTAIITLSSPTIAANVMAGVMVRSLRNFSPGDFILVGEYFGRVTEQNLFHVEIQTADRDLLTIPNSFIAANPTKVVHAGGTFVSAEVSLGYDIFHGDAENALLAAATSANLADPFVHVLNLGDFSVNYRVSGFLADVKNLLSVRSKLRTAMLDQLHLAGIEIVSPNFMNQRQISTAFIPQKIYPQSTRRENITEEVTPESLIFDKAERAQQIEELGASYQELKEEIIELEKQGAEEAVIEKKRRRLKAIKRATEFQARQNDTSATAKKESTE